MGSYSYRSVCGHILSRNVLVLNRVLLSKSISIFKNKSLSPFFENSLCGIVALNTDVETFRFLCEELVFSDLVCTSDAFELLLGELNQFRLFFGREVADLFNLRFDATQNKRQEWVVSVIHVAFGQTFNCRIEYLALYLFAIWALQRAF